MLLITYIQLSLFGKTSWERFLQMTGWTLEPSYPPSRTPKFQCLLREDGETPEWCEGERLMCAGGSWTPSIGQAPEGWHEGSGFSSWRILEADVPQTYYFKPRPMLPLPPPCGEGGWAAAEGDRTASFETGRQIPVIHPFQCFRMRGAAKRQEETAFRNSFGLPTDPFPTLLASDVTPFAFWYEGDPKGGCIRFLTETESERLMGLPEGWTKYGADGVEIRPLQRYKALGNAIALPCADYIMAGIYEVLADRAGKEE